MREVGIGCSFKSRNRDIQEALSRECARGRAASRAVGHVSVGPWSRLRWARCRSSAFGSPVLLAAGDQSWEGRDGDLLIVPDSPHSLQALQDSAVLLTVAKHLPPRA